MSQNELANYSFIPWIRKGVARDIKEIDSLGQNDQPITDLDDIGENVHRPTIDGTLILEDTDINDSSKSETDIKKTFLFAGPIDVQGFNENAIVRREPSRKNLGSFPAHYLPYIEFYDEDFPWAYTPCLPQITGPNQRKHRPWIILIVLEDAEYKFTNNPVSLPYIHIKAENIDRVLPPHDEIWAWAHVHVNSKLPLPDGTSGNEPSRVMEEKLSKNLNNSVSRILCPRDLQANTRYTAFVIPTFEGGRLAGLGESVGGIDAQHPAWITESGSHLPSTPIKPFYFPVYYQWKFATGEEGDFETLVRKLKPMPGDSSFGTRALFINNPGYNLKNSADTDILELEGVLFPVGKNRMLWPTTDNDYTYQNKLKNIINLTESFLDENNQKIQSSHPYYADTTFAEDPIIVPPIYGKHHAAIKKLEQNATCPAWIRTLNLDPRNRVAAGIGVEVVQKNQETFMEEAWRQIEKVNEANHKIRQAELAKQINKNLFKKHINSLPIDKLMGLSFPIHKKITNNSDVDQKETLYNSVTHSQIPNASICSSMRKVIRPVRNNSRILSHYKNKMQIANSTNDISLSKDIISKFNTISENDNKPITAAIPKTDSKYSITTDQVTETINKVQEKFNKPSIRTSHILMDILYINRHFNETVLLSKYKEMISTYLNDHIDEYGLQTDQNKEKKENLEQLIDNIIDFNYTEDLMPENGEETAQMRVSEVTIDKEFFQNFFGEDITGKFSRGFLLKRELEPNEIEKVIKMTTKEEIEEYHSRFNEFKSDSIVQMYQPPVYGHIAALDSVKISILNQINPQFIFEKRIKKGIKRWSNTENKFIPVENLKPVMAYPEIGMPMINYLKKISVDYFLPGIGKIPNNSVSLVQPNFIFIESFMCGLNYEMARELLWREFPTDLRSTCFRKFWESKDAAKTDQIEFDISAIDSWQGDLGTHQLKSAHIYLLIRGDLLRIYPNTLVYAQKAQFKIKDGITQIELPRDLTPYNRDNLKFPVFQTDIDPDITLLAFDLTAEEAIGNRNQNNPGWFFILRERPGQTQFGIDTPPENSDNLLQPQSWNQLTWGHMIMNVENGCINISANSSLNLAPGAPAPAPTDAQWGADSADMAYILLQQPIMYARHAEELVFK